MGFGFFIGVWVVCYLGLEKFGLLNYAIVFVSLFNVFVILGLNNIVVWELVCKLLEKGEIFGILFLLKLFGSLLLFILIFGVIYIFKLDKS